MQACCSSSCDFSKACYTLGVLEISDVKLRRKGYHALKCCEGAFSGKPLKHVKCNRTRKWSDRLPFSLALKNIVEKSSLDSVDDRCRLSKDLNPPNQLRILNSPNFEEKDVNCCSINEDALIEEKILPTRKGENFLASSEVEETQEPLNPDGMNPISSFLLKATSVLDKTFSGISPRIRGLILLNILTALYGSNITVVKEAQESLDAASFNAGRFAIASLAFSPWIYTAFKDESSRNAGIELGIWAILGYATQAFGLLFTGAGRASFLCTFTVIEVPIIAGLFGAKIPPVTWFAAASALVGVSLLESPGVSSSLLGDFWCLISALFFGIHMLRSEHHSKHITPQNAVSMIGLQMAVMAAFSMIWASFIHTGELSTFFTSALGGDFSPLLTSMESVPWPLMVYTGVISTACCLWIEIVTLRSVSASEAAMVYSLEPIYGACFAWVLLGERWGLKGWFGALLVVGGSLAMQVFGGKDDEADDFESQSSLISEEFDLLESPGESEAAMEVDANMTNRPTQGSMESENTE